MSNVLISSNLPIIMFSKFPSYLYQRKRRWMQLSHRSSAWKVSKYGVTSGPNTGKYGPEITPYLDAFHVVELFAFTNSGWAWFLKRSYFIVDNWSAYCCLLLIVPRYGILSKIIISYGKQARGVFRTQSNICNGAFLQKELAS